MSKIEGARHTAAIHNYPAENRAPRGAERAETAGENVYRQNNDSAHEKFFAREGIERAGRGRGNGHRHAQAHGHHGKHKGDTINISIEGIGDTQGRVLEETADTLTVIVDNEIYLIDKKTGKSRGNRHATKSEMQESQQMQQSQRQVAETQEQRHETIVQEIKESNNRYEAHIAELRKEARLNEAEAFRDATNKKTTISIVRTEQGEAAAAVSQIVDSEAPQKSLSITEVILGVGRRERAKGGTD